MARAERRTGKPRGRDDHRSPSRADVAGPPSPPSWERGRTVGLAVALATLTVLVYAPVARHGFVALDDPAYITENPHLAGGWTWPNVVWAFTSGYAANWHPLTWLSHMLDVQWYGLQPAGHHLTNVAFHVANTLLLFGVLLSTTRRRRAASGGAVWKCAFVAAVFAVHPLHVESVAWAAERKDVLSTCFEFLALWAYAGYVRTADWRRYAAVVALFALALMAKPMVVTMPLVLLLLDVWPLGRRRSFGLWLEKLPLAVLAIVSSVVTVIVQRQGGTVATTDMLPLQTRAANVCVSYLVYIGKLLWPTRLAVFYPYRGDVPTWEAATAAAIVAGLSWLAVRAIRSRPYVFVGWFWYLGTLLPVIGLVQVGVQAMADRYTYVPVVGLCIVIAWGVPDLLAPWPAARRVLPAAALGAVLACAMMTHHQLATWQDTVAMWQNDARVILGQDDQQAEAMVVAMLRSQGRMSEIAEHAASEGPPPAPVVIESQIDGEFEGWTGETIFTLRNGEVWQQSAQGHVSAHAHAPAVRIYWSGAEYRMKVDGITSEIAVRRLK